MPLYKVLMFGAQCLEKELRENCSLNRHLLRKIVQIFWPNSLICWTRIKSIVGFNSERRPPIVRKQKQLSCRNSVIVLSAVDFGCHDPQTLCQLTSLCGDFLNRAYCNSPRHLEDLENNTEQAVAGTDQHTLREGAKNCEKGKCLSYKVVDIFSICRNYRLLNIFLVSLKK